jgi:hypothetical protein
MYASSAWVKAAPTTAGSTGDTGTSGISAFTGFAGSEVRSGVSTGSSFLDTTGAGLISFAAGLAVEVVFVFGAAEVALGVSRIFDGPSLVAGRRTDCALFGGVSGCFSRVFDADDVVGRIIRAKKPSSAGAVE